MSALEEMTAESQQMALHHLVQYVEKDRGDGIKEWHLVCYNDGQTIAVCSRGRIGYTIRMEETLALVAAHVRQSHTGRVADDYSV